MRSLAVLCLLAPVATMAADNRLILADQSDFANKRGFYLDLENSFPDGQLGELGTLRMILGVADGKNWRFLEYRPQAKIGESFVLDAHIDATGATLKVDGTKVSEAAGEFLPLGADRITANDRPAWAQAPVSYQPVQISLAIRVDGGPAHVWKLGDDDTGPLSLFESPLPSHFTEAVKPGQSVDLEARVRFDSPLDIGKLAPFIDRYGQAVYAQWPGKITSMAAMRKAQAEEANLSKTWTRPATWDAYGGAKDAGWTGKKTGFYHAEKHGTYWWMISPLGNPLFYTGICTAPANMWDKTPVIGREFLWEALPPQAGVESKLWERNTWGSGADDLYMAQHSWNLVRLFGQDFVTVSNQQCANRVARWGFTGLGKWSDALPNTPYMPVLYISGVDRPHRHLDVFDPTVKEGIEKSLRSQIVPNLKNPYVLGWSIGNEFDEIITKNETQNVLQRPGSSPVRRALIAEAVKTLYGGDEPAQRKAWAMASPRAAATVPDKDVEPLRQYYAKSYYGTLYSIVKKIDPNHPYYGFWIVPNWWENESDWDLIAPYCDVIGFDRYAESWTGIENLLAKYDKPVLLGEFSFPAWYDGKRGFGRYGVFRSSDADSGSSYAKLVDDASRDPRCIGTMWFQYRDQPLTGRGPGRGPRLVIGEHYAFGMVDVTDRPKWDLVKPAREANLRATKNRLSASK